MRRSLSIWRRETRGTRGVSITAVGSWMTPAENLASSRAA